MGQAKFQCSKKSMSASPGLEDFIYRLPMVQGTILDAFVQGWRKHLRIYSLFASMQWFQLAPGGSWKIYYLWTLLSKQTVTVT